MESRTERVRKPASSRPQGMLRPRVLMAAGAVASALLLAACGSTASTSSGSAPSSSPTAPVAATGALLATASTPLGSILVDGKGMTVYLFAADTPGHSACSGSCATYWPPVPAPATLPATLTGVTGTLGEITRTDGSKQLTVNGWPVYTYAADSAAGMASGQGKNLSGGLWWVLSPSGTAVKTSAGASSPSPSTSKSSAGGGWS
jgi:predicted lipoprotein with Yx(FWY)xxD motif